jgi:hypothetical protein
MSHFPMRHSLSSGRKIHACDTALNILLFAWSVIFFAERFILRPFEGTPHRMALGQCRSG